MTNITSKEQFERMLAEKQAALFLFFDWSGPAVVSLRLFESWVQEWRDLHPESCVAFYRLDPDAHPHTWTWIGQQACSESGNESGSGSVTWLRYGRSVAFVSCAARVGKDELSRLTYDHFGTLNAA